MPTLWGETGKQPRIKSSHTEPQIAIDMLLRWPLMSLSMCPGGGPGTGSQGRISREGLHTLSSAS